MRFIKYRLLVVFSIVAVFVRAQVYDYVVAKDGTGTHTTVQSAINDCTNSVRKLIFVKNGTYNEKVTIGFHSVTSSKLISLIGESAQNTIISWDDYNGKAIVYNGSSVISGTPQSATFTVNAPDFYAENITFKNTYNNAQAVAFYGVSDRVTFKNCKFIGFQDTHYTKKGRRSYYQNCYIEGGVDYICAGGTCIFDSCTLKSLRNGGSITAPEDIAAFTTVDTKTYYYGFIFRNCTLNSDDGILPYLGRPWQATSSSVFLNCKMNNVTPSGWSTWSGTNHLSSFFAEYNSRNLNGNLVDVSQRVSWSYQLSQKEIDIYYTNAKIYSFSSTAYDPFTIVQTPAVPQSLRFIADKVTWNSVPNVKGYAVLKNGIASAFVVNPQYILNDNDYNVTFAVKAIGANGNLSDTSESILTNVSGVNEQHNKLSLFQVLPNTIKFEKVSNVLLCASNGRELFRGKTTEIDTKPFRKTVCVLKFFDAGNNSVFKIKLI
ncbi:MAG: pectinesterase family protein [Paludibacter sp.]